MAVAVRVFLDDFETAVAVFTDEFHLCAMRRIVPVMLVVCKGRRR